MKIIRNLLYLIASLSATHQTMQASSLDGTAGIVYATPHEVFHTGDVVRGFVRINGGFSIAPANSVLFDTFITVSGGIDLKSTGDLILNNNLTLDSGVTLTTGGIISGRGHAINLNGALTLTSTSFVRTLTIRSDTIFDGQGKSLVLGNRSQLFVESNVTLTLRNLVLKTGRYSQTPPIQLASLGSKLALENVVIELGSDFDFRQGQIFIHNDVTFTGTSAFIYRSPRPSYITTDGLLIFDKGTTFSVAPSTFTDVLFSNIPTTTSSNFLVMQDASSTLFLDGCSFKTTYTGLRLTRGNLFFDNRVDVDTAATSELSGLSLVGSVASGAGGFALSWSPDGRFISVVNDTSNTMQVYQFNGVSAPTTIAGTISTGTGPEAVAWSPDARFIAVSNFTAGTLQIYRFNGNGSPTTIGSAVATGAGASFIMWSPDRKFIGIVNDMASTLQIYAFDGSNTPTLVGSSVSTGANPRGLAWSSDGRFLAVIASVGSSLQIFTFDGINTPTTVGGALTTAITPRSVAWSPDGRFIAVVSDSTTLQIYSFAGNNTPSIIGATAVTGTNPRSVQWSPDGRYIAVANFSSNNIQIFQFGGSNTPTLVGSPIATGTSPNRLAWSPDGRFLGVVNNTSNTLQIFSVVYINPSSPQPCSQGLIFGNSIIGSSENLNVRFLGGAHVEVTGKVHDDSI